MTQVSPIITGWSGVLRIRSQPDRTSQSTYDLRGPAIAKSDYLPDLTRWENEICRGNHDKNHKIQN